MQDPTIPSFYKKCDLICPVCNSKEQIPTSNIFDDRYGCPEMFNLMCCVNCGHMMTSPAVQEEQLGALYSTYYPRKHVVTSDLLHTASTAALRSTKLKRWWSGTNNQGQYRVSCGQVMLDVGCGSGLSLLEAKELGAEVFGIEADPNVRRIADELELQIHIGSLYDEPFKNISFDLIVLNQVIEHIPDPGKAMQELKKRLKPNGRLILVFPNRRSIWQRLFGLKWINWHVPYHLHHFDSKGFRTFAQRHGYTIISQKTITPNIWSILQLRVLRQSSKIGVSSPIWDVKSSEADIFTPIASGLKISKSRIFRKLIKQIAFITLGLFNRFIDLIGQGDSILVELRIHERR